MHMIVSNSRAACGRAAAECAAQAIRAAIDANGAAAVILATGASQFDMLDALVRADGIGWPKVTCFHLDEYIGLPAAHPASFRRYLKERFVDRLPEPPRAFHYVGGEAPDPEAECRRLGDLLREHTIDAAMVGIGENGHLAFNDPPADFRTAEPYLVVDLDEACRRQQLGEGWFETLDDVPRRAISMSIRQIMASRTIVCTVPDRRKAEAVRAAVEGPVTPDVPASILQEHPSATLYLDTESASLLAE
ncbi:MAG: glucosamine-6-phosphate deaminase [Planctomycetes bacterium]|nr:glucosamine-6-phosphate deaminase [Planctomycetota bacterium]